MGRHKQRTGKLFRDCALSLVFLIAILTVRGHPLQEKTRSDESASCHKFTQDFYDWYAPLTQDISPKAVSDAQRKIREREPEVLSPKLLRALRADNDAQARAKGELVGLDFDPFLGSQDPGDHYEARRVHLQGNACSVEVWRASSNVPSAKLNKPDVVAILSSRDGHWWFVNFKYPALDNSDLLTDLAALAKERAALAK